MQTPLISNFYRILSYNVRKVLKIEEKLGEMPSNKGTNPAQPWPIYLCKLLHVSPQQEAGSKASSSRKRSSIWSSSISSSLFYFWPTLTFWLMSGEGDSAPVSSKFAATKPLLRWEEWFTATSLVESYLYHHLLANGYLEASCYFRSENGWPLLWFGFI